MSKEWKLGLVSFVVCGGQIEKHGGLADEFNLCIILIDLLEKQTRYDARRSLIEIMPVRTPLSKSHLMLSGYISAEEFGNVPDLRYCFFISRLLFAAYEEVALFPLAALDFHKLIELQHSPLATRPSFAAFVEQGLSWMIDTFFIIS